MNIVNPAIEKVKINLSCSSEADQNKLCRRPKTMAFGNRRLI